MDRATIRQQLLGATETAATLKVTLFTLWKWRCRGTLRPILRAGHNYVYWRADVAALAADPALVASLVRRGRRPQKKAAAP